MSKKTNSNKAVAKTNERLVYIDMMVGMAMVLVVLGHLSVGFEPEWYHSLHNWIYSFHMEMFLFLSAFLIRYTYKGADTLKDYGKYIWRKFKKFFVWFLVIGIGVSLLACPVKGIPLTTGHFLHSLRNLLLYPRWSEASFLWYIYVLFGYYLVSPLFFKTPQWFKTVCCIAALFLPMLNAGQMLAAYDFSRYTFFYCLGVLCAEWIDEIRSAKVWLWGLASLPFLVFSYWVFAEGAQIGFEYPQLGWWYIVTGTAALPFFYLLAMAVKKIKPLRVPLASVSRNCYWIYLLQMFIIWGCARLATRFGLAQTMPFWIFLVVTTLLAIAIPIALAETYAKLKGCKSKHKEQTHS